MAVARAVNACGGSHYKTTICVDALTIRGIIVLGA